MNQIKMAGLAICLLMAVAMASGCRRVDRLEMDDFSWLYWEMDASRAMGFPTDRQGAHVWYGADTFQPTASGRPESALFGSVRSGWVGRSLLPRFHEGLDIAPVRPPAGGRTLDNIYAVTAGRVAYLNKIAGNSSYGKYIVLAHDSTVGEIYTLYAHLSRIEPHLAIGNRVAGGEKIGVMGNTSTLGIPLPQSHLHFEIALLLNSHYDVWYRRQKLKPDHGKYNGGNLFGMDPLEVFHEQEADEDFAFLTHIAGIPRAFEVVLDRTCLPDFFQRHPRLWQENYFAGHGLVVAASENGLPLGGRNATSSELAGLKPGASRVLHVDPDALGRNGCRLVTRRGGKWELTGKGNEWLQILTYR